MPLRLITWNIHVSFSAPKCRDKKDWVRLYGSFLLQWICIYFLKKYFTKLQSWNFRFHQALNEMDHNIWDWKNRGSFLAKTSPSQTSHCILDVFVHVESKLRATKIVSNKPYGFPRRKPQKSSCLLLCCAFFPGPNLVWSLDYTTRPSQRERAQPRHLAEHQRF